jgi:hypothetical protein
LTDETKKETQDPGSKPNIEPGEPARYFKWASSFKFLFSRRAMHFISNLKREAEVYPYMKRGNSNIKREREKQLQSTESKLVP